LDEQHTNKKVNDAAHEYAQTYLGSYRTVWDHFMEAQQRQERLAHTFIEDTTVSHLRTQAERNLSASEELVEQARKGKEANQILLKDIAKQSANAYEEFLDSLYLYYRQSVRTAEMRAPQ
jgi:hypothetical protein